MKLNRIEYVVPAQPKGRLCSGPDGLYMLNGSSIPGVTDGTYLIPERLRTESAFAADSLGNVYFEPAGERVCRYNSRTHEFFWYEDEIQSGLQAAHCVSSEGHVISIGYDPNSLDFFLPSGVRPVGLWEPGVIGTLFETPPDQLPFWELGATSIHSNGHTFVVCGMTMGRVDHYSFDGKWIRSIQGLTFTAGDTTYPFTALEARITRAGLIYAIDVTYVAVIDKEGGLLRMIDLSLLVGSNERFLSSEVVYLNRQGDLITVLANELTKETQLVAITDLTQQ